MNVINILIYITNFISSIITILEFIKNIKK